MRCDDLDELIEALADGEPVPPEVQAHVADCAGCRARLDMARAVNRLLIAREVPVPPDAFTTQVMQLVRKERWRIEQFVDAGFNVAIAAGLLVIGGGLAGLLWSLGWFSIDEAALTAVANAVAPWTTRLVSQVQMVVVAAALLSSALALWWWMEGGEAA